MASVNIVVLAGNLTRDPELRYTPNGIAVCDLGLAVNRHYTVGQEKREDVLFINCVVWGKQAENAAQYLSKGSGVLVEGRLQSQSWEDRGGQKRTKIEVVAEKVQYLTYKDKGGARGAREPGDEPRRPSSIDSPDDSEVPF